ncbi:MAG: type II toxin-antitoxin system PemK/MazF family toxin, partial [Rickettsiales bacterium]
MKRIGTTEERVDKNFEEWNARKRELDAKKEPRSFKEGDVWWCSIGLNVGYEIFGKSAEYTRPVLILRKYTYSTFFALPLSTKRKKRPSYRDFEFNEIEGSVILDQGRTLDGRRLLRRMGQVPKNSLG